MPKSSSQQQQQRSLTFLKDAVSALATTYAVSTTVVLYLLYGFNGDLREVDAYLSGHGTSTPWSFHEDRLLRVKIKHPEPDSATILTTQRTQEEISERIKFLYN